MYGLFDFSGISRTTSDPVTRMMSVCAAHSLIIRLSVLVSYRSHTLHHLSALTFVLHDFIGERLDCVISEPELLLVALSLNLLTAQLIPCAVVPLGQLSYLHEQVLPLTVEPEQFLLIVLLNTLDILLHKQHRGFKMLLGCLQSVLIVHGLSELVTFVKITNECLSLSMFVLQFLIFFF